MGLLLRKGREGKVRDGRGGEEKGEKGEMGEGRGGEGEGQSPHREILDPPLLVADLEQDPFVSSAIQTACYELYYRYGMYLASLTAALTTAKHCHLWSSC